MVIKHVVYNMPFSESWESRIEGEIVSTFTVPGETYTIYRQEPGGTVWVWEAETKKGNYH
jgi:hypothetical protein